MDKRHVFNSLRGVKSKAGKTLAHLRKHYPVVFALMVIAGAALLVLGFATGYAETFKAVYVVTLERVLELAFGKEAAAASVVEEVADKL